jgi:hypothetical protein
MNHSTDEKPRDSFDYCLDFWDAAIDAEDEIEFLVRERTSPRQVRASDDAA